MDKVMNTIDRKDILLKDIDLKDMTDQQLDVVERKIAGKYMRVVPWGTVAWGIGNCLIFISLFPLVLMDLLPLWIAFPIATLNTILAYLPSHDAQHNIIAGRGMPLRWLNELLGHISTIPIVLPYRVLRATHMEHHRHCNDPEKDCDYSVHAPTTYQFFVQSFKNRQPGSAKSAAYPECLERTGQAHLIKDFVLMQFAYLLIIFALAWTGHAIEAFLLWWLPKHIAQTYLSYYLSWAPHHPAEARGRYRDTRAFKSRLGNIFSMGMQYHIVHHLYPRIPLTLTPAAYRELKPILKLRGAELGGL